MERERSTNSPAGGWYAGGGLLAGLSALISASCCVLPILLVQAGLSTALVAHLGIFARVRPYLLTLTALLIAAGFIAAFWGGRQPRPLVLWMLIMATALVIAAVAAPYYERELLELLRPSR